MDWTLDQALIWIAMRNRDEVERSRSDDPKHKLTWLNIRTYVHERPYYNLDHDQPQEKIDPELRVKRPDREAWASENLKVWPSDAEQLLLESLQDGRLTAFSGGDDVKRSWFVGARLQAKADYRAELVHIGGGEPARLEPLFRPDDLVAIFPEAATSPLGELSNSAELRQPPLAPRRVRRSMADRDDDKPREDLRSIERCCATLAAERKLSDRVAVAARDVKRRLGSQIAWDGETLRQIFSDRYGPVNALVESDQVVAFWRKYWPKQK